MIAPDAIVRRYCSCAVSGADCCDLPQRHSGWTVPALTELRDQVRRHGSAAAAAVAMGESLQRCNIALNAMLGRSPAHALAALERQAARS